MAGGSHKPVKGAGGVAVVEEDSQQGGGNSAGIRIFLQRRGPFGADYRCRNLGGHPLHGPGPGRVTTQGVDTIDREAPAATDRRKMVIHLGGGGKRGGGI